MGVAPWEQPDLRPVAESGQLYVVFEDWICVSKAIKVPLGYRTDGASAPKWSLSLIGFQRDGIHRAAALAHDWLYSNRGTITLTTGQMLHYDRQYADSVFYAMLIEAGIKNWHAWLAYHAVRTGGWFYWKE